MLRREGMHFILLFTLTACTAAAVGPVMNDAPPTVYEQIKNRTDLSEFFNLVTSSQLVSALLQSRQATVFAPNNEAMANFQGEKGRDLLLYHIANVALTTGNLDQSVSSELPGNPPLWISRRDATATAYDLYINDAKVIVGDILATSTYQDKQVLHIIDKVLEPIKQLVTERLPFIPNPDAAKFIERSGSFDLGENRISEFAQLVKAQDKMNVFAAPGVFTFFIPVNKGIENISRTKIGKQVIDAHVIPNVVLFARTALDGRPAQTLAFNNDLKITVAFNNHSDSGPTETSRVYVQSNTLMGDYHHPRGIVVTHIVKANIPVRNGVVHLINKPLVVVDKEIVNFLKSFEVFEQRNGILHEFYRIIKDYSDNFMESLTGDTALTLLAPSNEAFRRLGEANLNALLSNRPKLTEILQLHVIRRRLSSEEILQNPLFSEEMSSARGRRLYFNAYGTPENMTITVEGNGVNATLIQPDIGAKDGVVHIIDRVLGVPSMTVVEKLATDPIMSYSNQVAVRSDWLNDIQKTRDYTNTNMGNNKVTFLVPSNAAWDSLRSRLPSVHKKLFMEEFAYHAKQLLNRHFSLNGGLTMEELLRSGAQPLNTVSTSIVFTNSSLGEYSALWNSIEARIVRPDVECTDGVIHVIDRVLLIRGDIAVAGQSKQAIFNPVLILLTACMFALQWN